MTPVRVSRSAEWAGQPQQPQLSPRSRLPNRACLPGPAHSGRCSGGVAVPRAGRASRTHLLRLLRQEGSPVVDSRTQGPSPRPSSSLPVEPTTTGQRWVWPTAWPPALAQPEASGACVHRDPHLEGHT